MFSRFAADLVLLAHLAFVLFVVLGGWLVLRRPWIAWFHIPAALWGATVELMGWVCPLTPLENQLRAASGSAGYDGSFIARYLIPVVYPTSLTRPIQIALGLAVVLINLAVYGMVIRRWLSSRK